MSWCSFQYNRQSFVKSPKHGVTFDEEDMRTWYRAESILRQAAYWPMHEALYSRQAGLPDVDLAGLAGNLGLDVDAFRDCMADERVGLRIDADLAAAKEARVAGTPAFLIGVPEEGRIRGRVIVGFQPLSVYEAEIRDCLAGDGGS